MRRSSLAVSLVLAGLVVGLLAATATLAVEPTTEKGKQTPVRVGTFDSRFVTIAYSGSARHEASIRRLDKALENAKRDGDAEQIKKADHAIWEIRLRSHRQAFGTWPVDNILKQYPEAVEQVKKDAKVAALVSKWDKKALAKYSDAEKVDVTLRLVDAMKPGERQRRMVVESMKKASLQGHKPLGPKELEKALKAEAGEHYLPPPSKPKPSGP